jgi:hypothetical protein
LHWIAKVKNLTVLCEIREVDLGDAQLWLPPVLRGVGEAWPFEGRRRCRLTFTLPTGAFQPHFGRPIGDVRLYMPERQAMAPDGFWPLSQKLVTVATGIQVLGARAQMGPTDWTMLDASMHQTLGRSSQLDAVSLILQGFEARLAECEPDERIEQYWELEIEDYYRLALQLVKAACDLRNVLFAPANVLLAFRYWWDETLDLHRGTPQGKQVEAAYREHIPALNHLIRTPTIEG